MTAWWILVAAGIAWLVWVVASVARRPGADEVTTEAVLLQRYADGEMDREEYRERLSVLLSRRG